MDIELKEKKFIEQKLKELFQKAEPIQETDNSQIEEMRMLKIENLALKK